MATQSVFLLFCCCLFSFILRYDELQMLAYFLKRKYPNERKKTKINAIFSFCIVFKIQGKDFHMQHRLDYPLGFSVNFSIEWQIYANAINAKLKTKTTNSFLNRFVWRTTFSSLSLSLSPHFEYFEFISQCHQFELDFNSWIIFFLSFFLILAEFNC